MVGAVRWVEYKKNLSPKELLDGANNFYLDVSVKKT